MNDPELMEEIKEMESVFQLTGKELKISAIMEGKSGGLTKSMKESRRST